MSRRSGVFIDCIWVLIDSMVKQSMSPLEWLATPWNFRGKSTIPSYSKYTVSGHKYLVIIGLSFNFTPVIIVIPFPFRKPKSDS